MITRIKIARTRILFGMALVVSIALAGCGDGDQTAEQQKPGQSAADAPLAGVTFESPGHWQDIGPEGMRKAQYRLAPVKGDAAAAEVNVFYFGPQSGGGVEANLQRWIGQMTLPDGGDPSAAAQRSTFTAGGMPCHMVSLDGSYKSGGGRPMGGGGEIMPGYRLVGVVIEGPQGSLFFKLTGPAATARQMEVDLLAMVKSARILS